VIELIDIFVNNIAPILIVAGAGYAAGKLLKIESRSIGQLIFNVFSPALVFFSLYDSKIGGDEFGVLIAITILFQVVMAMLSYVIMRVQKVNDIDRASVMISTFCLNAGNYGLSLVNFAFGEEVLARAVVISVANTILNYTLGVFVSSSGRQSPGKALLNIAYVPAVYATAAALILKGLNIELPLVVFRAVSVMKDAAIPAMLILLGLQMAQTITLGKWSLLGWGLGLKLLASPVIGVGLAMLFRLNGAEAIAFILQASMPTAVVTLIMAKEYQLDETLVLNLIVVSTLVSPFTLSVVILLLRQAFLPL
jgi:malate permease and related proteins